MNQGLVRRGLILAGFLIFIYARFLSALDPHELLTKYVLDTWARDIGLPQTSCHGIRQTTEGSLWLGTEEGLVCFEGVRFTIFDQHNVPAIHDNFIQALIEDRDGILWIG